MTEMTVLNGVAIEELLTIPMAMEAVEQAYLEKSKGDAALWPMVFHEFDSGHADLDIKSGDLGGRIAERPVRGCRRGGLRGQDIACQAEVVIDIMGVKAQVSVEPPFQNLASEPVSE